MSGGAELRRVIGFWGGTALIIGITIGSGIFRKPGRLAELVPDPAIILGLWALFGVICICGALAVAELSAMMPQTGGVYRFLRAAYGDAAAFVFGWLYLLVTVPAAIGALSAFFAELLLKDFLGVPPDDAHRGMYVGVACGTIVLLTIPNLLGTRLGTGVQGVLTAIKVAALIAIIAISFALGRGDFGHVRTVSPGPVGFANLAAAAASVIWAYDGWVAVSMIAGEVIEPERRMKPIIITGMLAIVVLYLGANLAYFYMLPLGAMATEKEGVPQRIMCVILGPVGGTAISLCIMASVFGALSANILTKPRVAYAMAKDGLTFGFVGRVHPRWGTPHVAILIQSAVAMALVLWLRNFDALTDYFVVVEWFALLFTVAAVFVLRKKSPDAPRPFRTPLYPWVPLFFMVGAGTGLAAIVGGQVVSGNFSPIIGLGIALAGFPVYFAWRRFTRGSGRGSPGPG